MAVIDWKKETLGRSAEVRRRRLAVLRYLLRGFTYSEAYDELSRLKWWKWSPQIVNNDMHHLRQFIKDYGAELPEIREAVAWALSYYDDTIKEYSKIAERMEREGRDDLAVRYRSMRDGLATRAFNALGVSSVSVSVTAGVGGNPWDAVKTFFGIDARPQDDDTNDTKGAGNGKKGKAKGKRKNTQ